MTTLTVETVLELPVKGGHELVALRISEGMSEHTKAVAELSSAEDLDFGPALHEPATIVVLYDGLEVRRLTLRVASGAFTRVEGGMLRYLVELESPFWFLGHTLNTRKFRNMTAREIISKVLDEGGIEHTWTTTRQPPRRKYCTQYRESNRAFVERLLEFEGIYHTTDEHGVLVLGDVSGASPELGPFELYQSAGGLTHAGLGLQEVSLGAQTASGKVSLSDFNWKKPHTSLLVSADAGASAELEVYDAAGGYRKAADGSTIAQIRLEALRAMAVTLEGRGTVPSFAPAHVFELGESAGAAFSGEYLLVGVEHLYSDERFGDSDLTRSFDDALGLASSSSSSGPTYSNRFVAIPRATHFRPAVRTPSPNLAGCHTAMVRGPAGQEIHTDPHGRFRAQFHWDREATGSDEDSRWMRMLQENHSSLFLARVGWEVNVAYIHGDPDRPIGLARDINGVMPPSYAQPSKKMMMTIKTPSTPATGGFNELKLDDSAGAMGFFVQAEKNLRNGVRNDHLENVANNEFHVQGASIGRAVTRDQVSTIGANSTAKVGGTHSVAVSKNRTVKIGGSETVKVAERGIVLVEGNETEKVGSVRLTIDGSIGLPSVASLVPSPKDTAKSTAQGAGTAAVGALQSGGGLSGAASAAGSSAQGSLQNALPQVPSLGEAVEMLLQGNIARMATKTLSRTVGGAYVSVSAHSIETSAGTTLFETIGGAKLTLSKLSIDQSCGKAFVLTVGGAIIQMAGANLGVSAQVGTTLVGGLALLHSDDKLEILGEEVEISTMAKLSLVGPKCSLVLEPTKVSMTGSVLFEPGEKLKTKGSPVNITKAGA